jgi:hypothetical protein
MPTDNPPTIQQRGTRHVLATRHEVMWRDGSACHLHAVCFVGSTGLFVPDTFLRALRHQAGNSAEPIWCVFDLRKVAGELDADIRSARAADVPGLIFYTLRHRYPSALAFEAAAMAAADELWTTSTTVTSTQPMHHAEAA